MATLSRKLQQLDEERERVSEKIKNTETRLEQVSEGVDESERSVSGLISCQTVNDCGLF